MKNFWHNSITERSFFALQELRRDFDFVVIGGWAVYFYTQSLKSKGFDVDIYVPHYSELGLPLESVLSDYEIIDGFKVPQKEFLLIMKIFTYKERKGNIKGEKDKIDIFSILNFTEIDWTIAKNIIEKNNLFFAREELTEIMKSTNEIAELGLNVKKTADLKRKITRELEENLI